jgi:uncharacterized protein
VNIVFDTNVLFAAYVATGLCAELYETGRDLGVIRVSPFILDELADKLAIKARLTPDEICDVIEQVRHDSLLVDCKPLAAPVCRDPDDDWILAAALAAQGGLIVTGDKDLLVLDPWEGIRILTPRQCLTILLTR